MNETFDLLKEAITVDDDKNGADDKNGGDDKKIDNDGKLSVKHELLQTTPNCSAESKKIIQEMYRRIDIIDHLIIQANAPLETWPIEHLKNLYKFEINAECDALKGESLPEDLKSLSYTDIIFNKTDEKIKPTIIRELLKRCKNPDTNRTGKTKKEAFCHSKEPKMTQQVIGAVFGDGSDFQKTKDVTYVVHTEFENIIDFTDKFIQLELFDKKQYQITASDWKTITLYSKRDICFDWTGSIFHRSAETLTHLDIRQLKEIGQLDTLSTAVEYFEKYSLSYKSLRLLVLSVSYTRIDSKKKLIINHKMTKLIGLIKNIVLIALVNTKFEIDSGGFCPKGWESFHSSVVVGCYRAKSVKTVFIPDWISEAMSQK